MKGQTLVVRLSMGHGQGVLMVGGGIAAIEGDLGGRRRWIGLGDQNAEEESARKDQQGVLAREGVLARGARSGTRSRSPGSGTGGRHGRMLAHAPGFRPDCGASSGPLAAGQARPRTSWFNRQ